MQLLKSRPFRARQALRLVHIRVTLPSPACCQMRLVLEYVDVVELDGIEPTTPGLQSRCSPS